MRMYVGITEYKWYDALKDKNYNEICLVKPAGNLSFRALKRDELYLFKLHSPQNYIVGGGYFVSFSTVPIFTAWDIFKGKTGAEDFLELEERIFKSSEENTSDDKQNTAGCIILSDPFFLKEEDWIPIPEDWNINIGHGKLYNIYKDIGRELYKEVEDRIERLNADDKTRIHEEKGFKVNLEPIHPLGEGAFKLMVTEAYLKSCAITGERVLPALKAGYIKPIALGGTNTLDNGILLRRDIYMLYNLGYITIDENYTVLVSSRLREDFNSGNTYYKYHGKTLKTLPEKFFELPSKEGLKWHKESVFLG